MHDICLQPPIVHHKVPIYRPCLMSVAFLVELLPEYSAICLQRVRAHAQLCCFWPYHLWVWLFAQPFLSVDILVDNIVVVFISAIRIQFVFFSQFVHKHRPVDNRRWSGEWAICVDYYCGIRRIGHAQFIKRKCKSFIHCNIDYWWHWVHR